MKGRGAERKGESGERGRGGVDGQVGAVGESGSESSGRDTKDLIRGEGRARSSGTDWGCAREGGVCVCGGGGRPWAPCQ